MFKLTDEEVEELSKSQIVTLNKGADQITFTYKHGMIRGQLYKRACIQMYVAYPDYIRVRLIT